MLTNLIGIIAIIILVVAGTIGYVGTVVNFSAAQGEDVESSPLAAAVIAIGCVIIALIAWLFARFTGSGFLIPLVLSVALAVFAWRYASNGLPLTLPIGLVQLAIAIAAGLALTSTGNPGVGAFIKFIVIMAIPIIVTLIASIVFHSRAYWNYGEEATDEEDDDADEESEEPEPDEDDEFEGEKERRGIPWMWVIVLATIVVLIWIYAAFFVPAYPNLNILNLFK